MRTIRRLYFYAVAFVSLEVVLWGLIGLLRSAFTADIVGGSAQRLAQALALILVGVPVFGLHWWVAQKNARDEMDEHASGVRAFFLYAVLLAVLIPVVQNFLALINRLLLEAFRMSPYDAMIGGSQTIPDNLIALLMNALVAVYFIRILRADWKVIAPRDAFTDLRRVYRYIWLIYTLVMVVAGFQQLLRYVLETPSSEFGFLFRTYFVNGLTLLLVGTPLWVFAWKTVQDSLSESAERESLLRLGILYALALAGVVTVLSSGGIVLDVILNAILGKPITWAEFLQQVSGPLSLGIPLVGVWAYYGKWLTRAMIEVPEAPRRAGMRRLYYYILAAIGLTATFIGLSMLFSFVVDALLGDVVWADLLRTRLAGLLATLLVSLPLWWLTWRPMQAEALASGDSGDHARRSLVRKTILYLVMFTSVIGGMVSAGMLIYNLLTQLLGGYSGTFLQSVFKALELLILFVLLGVYHGLTLRRDGRMASLALADKHAAFPVVIFDFAEGSFSGAIAAAIQKQTPRLPFTIQPAGQAMNKETGADPRAVVLSADLALNPPEPLRKWLSGYNGSKLVIPNAAKGWLWIGNAGSAPQANANQAALALRQLAEGQEVRGRTPSSGWMIAIYVVAALFGLQVVIMLIGSLASLFSQ